MSKSSEKQGQRRIRIGDHFRHKKGTKYVVLQIAKHTETGEAFVIYRAVIHRSSGELTNNVWARPYDMFTDGRFEYFE